MNNEHQSVEYAKAAVRKGSVEPKYVKKQCREFLRIAEGKDRKYDINWGIVKEIDAVLKLAIMPKGLKAGKTLYECSEGYQWLLYVASLAVVYRDNPKKRRYETVLLEIARKNFKTFTVGTMFILLFILEPPLSKFYSVAPDGSLSREVFQSTCPMRGTTIIHTIPVSNYSNRFTVQIVTLPKLFLTSVNLHVVLLAYLIVIPVQSPCFGLAGPHQSYDY